MENSDHIILPKKKKKGMRWVLLHWNKREQNKPKIAAEACIVTFLREST